EFIGALMNVTAAKQAEEQLHRTQAELAHVTRVTTLGELTASLAHEVNQPLAAVVGHGQACVHWLDQGTSHLDEARRAAESIIGWQSSSRGDRARPRAHEEGRHPEGGDRYQWRR